jgi:hypothetical protein
VASAANLCYRANHAYMSTGANVPNIPGPLHPVLWRLCKAFAISDEEERSGEDWRLALVELKAAIRADGRSQPQFGVLSNQLQTAGLNPLYPFGGVTP